MNVLSLFDGMSCGQLALNRAGIKYENYYASEIDKYAIKVTQTNFPDTIQCGDICNLKEHQFPYTIDLLIGGSPCQGFSRAGKLVGMEDERSKLFWEYVRLKNELRPKYFLLENVYMRLEWQDIISQALDVEPIRINSNLVSAQNRDRLYWTNIPNVTQPEDKQIYFGDIREYDVNSKYIMSDNYLTWVENQTLKSPKQFKFIEDDCKTPTITQRYKSGYSRDVFFGIVDKYYFSDNAINWINNAQEKYNINLNIYKEKSKTRCLEASMYKKYSKQRFYSVPDFRGLRWLTPMECERLQTVPDNYTEGISDTQRYKMLGNGWTVDIIAHIFSFIKKDV